jgi:uncharacterized membrane protein YgdD (TMEM256/DUF423 family)
MTRTWLLLAGVNGFLAVALGAFGAHGLQKNLSGLPDAAKRMEWWQTAAHYHLIHAVALGIVACVALRVAGRPTLIAGWALQAGMVLFCGSLYLMTLTGQRWLGAVTPLGGVGFLVGWAAIVAAALRLPRA